MLAGQSSCPFLAKPRDALRRAVAAGILRRCRRSRGERRRTPPTRTCSPAPAAIELTGGPGREQRLATRPAVAPGPTALIEEAIAAWPAQWLALLVRVAKRAVFFVAECQRRIPVYRRATPSSSRVAPKRAARQARITRRAAGRRLAGSCRRSHAGGHLIGTRPSVRGPADNPSRARRSRAGREGADEQFRDTPSSPPRTCKSLRRADSRPRKHPAWRRRCESCPRQSERHQTCRPRLSRSPRVAPGDRPSLAQQARAAAQNASTSAAAVPFIPPLTTGRAIHRHRLEIERSRAPRWGLTWYR